MAKQTFEQYLDGREIRRFKAEERAVTRLERLEAKAEKMIGELVRDGRTVFYICPVGGKYRESTRSYDLIDFLIRNRYV